MLIVKPTMGSNNNPPSTAITHDGSYLRYVIPGIIGNSKTSVEIAETAHKRAVIAMRYVDQP